MLGWCIFMYRTPGIIHKNKGFFCESQAPLQSTVEHFWEMVVQEEVKPSFFNQKDFFRKVSVFKL